MAVGTVGMEVGNADGVIVALVGVSVGIMVGLDDGYFVGVLVGINVGVVVGSGDHSPSAGQLIPCASSHDTKHVPKQYNDILEHEY